MWIIDKDHLHKKMPHLPNRVGTKNRGYSNQEMQPEQCTKFRLYDDDNVLYYTGRISLKRLNGYADAAFAPLTWAEADSGCTRMDYLDPEDGEWRTL